MVTVATGRAEEPHIECGPGVVGVDPEHAEDPHIECGPGRHGVSNAFYVYLRDPEGHRVEIYTSDYFTGDPDHPVLCWSVPRP